MKHLINLIIFLLTFNLSYSQSDSLKVRNIEIKSYEIDSVSKGHIESKEILIDSIRIKVKDFDNKIEITSEFQNSKSELKTEFYFENNNLILVRFSEIGKLYKSDNAIKYTEYYYDCEELIEENFFTALPSTAICMGIPIDKDWNLLYGHNKSFTNKFLHSYSELLLEKFTTE
ncbi:hypothetical protein [Winogradskyella flava]|uniref:hypothetical protein n=1 Tax=Winogradskyella flava TaxID=1884876 RepID=UPI002491BB57|nr:hypothetical protein [Winogradskyella flava]